jgi:hypothetical protein
MTDDMINPSACSLPLVALEPADVCPACGVIAGAHRRHPTNSPKPQALDPLALTREVVSLRLELDLANKFNDLAVKERDLERLRVDRLREELATAQALARSRGDQQVRLSGEVEKVRRELDDVLEELRSIKLDASAALAWAVEPAYHNGQALRAVGELVRKYEGLRDANAKLVRGAVVIAAPKLAEFTTMSNTLAKISTFASTYGEDLVPRGPWSDSFGDGVRWTKSTLRDLLDDVEPTPPTPTDLERVRALPEPSTRAGELALRIAADNLRHALKLDDTEGGSR